MLYNYRVKKQKERIKKMKNLRKLTAWFIALSTIASCLVSVSAENTLRSWDFIGDWVTLGNPLGESWKDTYGNENTWGVHGYTGDYTGIDSEITPKCVSRDNVKLKAWYFGDYRDNLDLLGSNGMIRLTNDGGELYSRVLNGYNHAYTWTSPDNMVVEITVTGRRRHNLGNTFFDLYQNGNKIKNLLFKYSEGDGEGTGTARISVKKGDRIALTVSGTDASGSLSTEYNLPTFSLQELKPEFVGLGAWDYRNDAYAAAQNRGIYGDSYGGDNTWGIYFGKTVDENYKMLPGAYVSGNGLYWLKDPDNEYTKIYFSSGSAQTASEIQDKSYAEVYPGTDIYFVFTSPKEMYAKVNANVYNRWGRNTQDVYLYGSDGTLIKTQHIPDPAGSVGAINEVVGLKTGETVTIKISSTNNGTTAVNPYITIEEMESGKYNAVVDYEACGKPLASSWNTFDKEASWKLDYTNTEGETVEPIINGASSLASPNGMTFLPGTVYDVPNTASFVDETWSYINTNGDGSKQNLKWTAPKDGMITATYKGTTRWNNGKEIDGVWKPMHVGFEMKKNSDRICYFESAGVVTSNVGIKEKTFAVKKGDVINFVCGTVAYSDGTYGVNDVLLFSEVKYVGEASGELTFNNPEITEKDGVVTGTVTGTNESGNKAEAVIILAGYDAAGNLTNVAAGNLDEYNSEFSASVSFNKDEKDSEYKVFVWNSLGGMKPIK